MKTNNILREPLDDELMDQVVGGAKSNFQDKLKAMLEEQRRKQQGGGSQKP